MAASLDEAKAKSILRQVEFYLSDSNLPRDIFLKKTVQQSEDGLVSLALICSFSRMKSHLGLNAAVKPEDVPEETVLAVAEVLRRSSSLRVSEDGTRIGRSTVLLKPEEVLDQVDSRTVAASPLPYDVKLEDVESFFVQHGKCSESVMDSPAKAPAGRRGRVPGEEEEEEEEHHLNPFLSTSITKPSASKLQFRKEISRARWDEVMGMGEVIEKKGSMWTTTGIIRNGKLYCHIEEILHKPPSRVDVENLEKKCKSIPLKFCYVDHGRASFFSFNKVMIPSLP